MIRFRFVPMILGVLLVLGLGGPALAQQPKAKCGPQQAERALTDREIQQEAINQKLSADELAQAERLIKSAEEKTQKAVKLETTQPEVYLKYQREAKAEFEQAHKRSIKSEIYALRNQQMVFGFLGR